MRQETQNGSGDESLTNTSLQMTSCLGGAPSGGLEMKRYARRGKILHCHSPCAVQKGDLRAAKASQQEGCSEEKGAVCDKKLSTSVSHGEVGSDAKCSQQLWRHNSMACEHL